MNLLMQYKILIVDDEPMLTELLADYLGDMGYLPFMATDSVQAMEKLKESPDLILLDINMPGMDGFELCKTIKSNVGYSHIPIILLTAKTNIQSKIEGMELGADSYIEKPFSPEYLLAVVSNLINNREKLRRDFAKSPFVAVNTMALTKADEEFIKKLNEIILSNLSNQEFSMDDMAESLNMSRSSFYNKLKALTDQAPADYIRLIRLKRAAQLLSEGQYNISEISDMTGFNDVKYFREVFKKYYKISPSGYSKGEMKEEPTKP